MYEKDLLLLPRLPSRALIRRQDKFCEVLLEIDNTFVPITSYRTSGPRRFFTLDTAVNRIAGLFPHIVEITVLQVESRSTHVAANSQELLAPSTKHRTTPRRLADFPLHA